MCLSNLKWIAVQKHNFGWGGGGGLLQILYGKQITLRSCGRKKNRAPNEKKRFSFGYAIVVNEQHTKTNPPFLPLQQACTQLFWTTWAFTGLIPKEHSAALTHVDTLYIQIIKSIF